MNSLLILCVEEHDNELDKSSVDNRIFIGYDDTDDTGCNYFLRGKRQDTATREFVPYAFHCKSSYNLFHLLDFVIGRKNNVSVVLYNFNNIYEKAIDSLTYEFFEEHMDINYEIAGYDNIALNCDFMVKNIKMLKNLYNYKTP
jgi:hypothetical protein